MVTFSRDGKGKYVADYTQTEIIEAATSGIAVYGVLDKDIYTLTQINEDAVNFHCNDNNILHILSVQTSGITGRVYNNTVDLTYHPNSKQAQSGYAVAEVIAKKVKVIDFYYNEETEMFDCPDYTSTDIANMINDYAAIFGAFWNNGDEIDYYLPLTIDGGERNFGYQIGFYSDNEEDGTSTWKCGEGWLSYVAEAVSTNMENINTLQNDMGNIETALNNIIAIQENLIGGNN